MRIAVIHALVTSMVVLAACPEQVSKICEPGETQACLCSGGQQGAQVCHGQGSSWLDCECGVEDAGVTADAAQLDSAGTDTATADTAAADIAAADIAQTDAASGDTLARDASAQDGSMCVGQDGGPVPCDLLCGAEDCAVDILFVIDNSGSMSEEQQQLAFAAAAANDPASPCNAGLADLQTYVAGNPGLPVADWDAGHRATLASCGFIERLLLSGNKFRLGVITTDMNDCDSPFGSSAQRPAVPQRGCLQTGTAEPSLTVLDWQTANLAQRFGDIVTSVLTYGSPYEKGLAAARHFLTPGHDVPSPNACDVTRNCNNDLNSFLRQTETTTGGELAPTKLLLVFITDEEDCSHGGAIDENVSGNTDLCYTNPELLLDPSALAADVIALKPQRGLISVGVLAGYHYGASGPFPSGCKPAGDSESDDCNPAYGNSVSTCTVCVDETPVCPCHPALTCPGGSQHPAANCCQADAADRYDQFARQMQAHSVDSICNSSYKASLNEILAAALPRAPYVLTAP